MLSGNYLDHLDQVPFGIVLLDEDLMITGWNGYAGKILIKTTDQEDLMGLRIIEDTRALVDYCEEIRSYTNDPDALSYKVSITLDYCHMDFSFFRGQQGFTLLIQDQTEEKELETNSIQSIIAGQENERRRLAREIHDGIAPYLSSAKLELDLFLEDLKEADEHISLVRLKNIRDTMDSISSDLRDLSHRLIPRLLEEFGMFSAFQNLIYKVNANVKFPVEFYSNMGQEERLNHDIELNLFRCGQELLSNAIKHAGANKITVQLIRHAQSIVLMIEDDGVGFHAQARSIDRDGIGLTNVETRVRSLNGEFIIESYRQNGTLVSIEIPLHT